MISLYKSLKGRFFRVTVKPINPKLVGFGVEA